MVKMVLNSIFTPTKMADKVVELIANLQKFASMRQNAHQTVLKSFGDHQSIQQY